MAFLLGAFAGVETHRTQTGAFEGQIEFADAVVGEALSGGNRSRAVIWLHKDSTESVGTPIGLQEGRFVAVVAGKTRAGGDALLDFVKEQAQGGSPTFDWDGLAVVQFDELAKGLELNLEPGAAFVVKVAELNEGVQGLAGSRKGPIGDHVKLGLGGTVAIAG